MHIGRAGLIEINRDNMYISPFNWWTTFVFILFELKPVKVTPTPVDVTPNIVAVVVIVVILIAVFLLRKRK